MPTHDNQPCPISIRRKSPGWIKAQLYYKSTRITMLYEQDFSPWLDKSALASFASDELREGDALDASIAWAWQVKNSG